MLERHCWWELRGWTLPAQLQRLPQDGETQTIWAPDAPCKQTLGAALCGPWGQLVSLHEVASLVTTHVPASPAASLPAVPRSHPVACPFRAAMF